MPKERSINPAAQQRKAEKQKAVAKGKKQVQAQRNEKLARRNPERLQRQIDELKELDARSALRPKDKETLVQLERDLRGINRAREALGDAAPKFAERRDNRGGDVRQDQRDRRQQQQQQHLGKRRRGEEDAHDSGSDTDPEVRDIPMPRDTPPPIPRKQREPFKDPQVGPDGQRMPHALPSKPVQAAPAQTVYSSAPQLRDLKKEAVRFMPSVVQAQRARVKGQGRLLEPEEADRLEKAGYTAATKAANAVQQKQKSERLPTETAHPARAEGVDLDEETRRFEMELAALQAQEEGNTSSRGVQIDDVEDEGD